MNTTDSKAGGSTTETKKEIRVVGCYIVRASREVLFFHIENKHMLCRISVEDSDLTDKYLQKVQYKILQ